MALKLNIIGERIATGYDETTGEFGFLRYYWNARHGDLLKGLGVQLADVVNEPDDINIYVDETYITAGVTAQDILDGQWGWVWISNSRCQAMAADGVTTNDLVTFDKNTGYVVTLSTWDSSCKGRMIEGGSSSLCLMELKFYL